MISAVASLIVLSLAAPKGPAVRFVNPAGLAKSPRYSHVAEVSRGRVIYVSGQVAQDASGNLVGAGHMAAQTRQVFENIRIALAASGASFKHVVKLTSFLVDMSQIDEYRDVRSEYLKDNPVPPASTTVGVSRLVRDGYLLEVEVIAVVP